MLIIPLFILILLLGLEFTIVLGVKAGLPERLSLAFLLGMGLLTFFVYLLASVFNLNFSLTNTFIVLISLCVVAFVVQYKKMFYFVGTFKSEKIVVKPKIAVFWSFILAIFAYTLLVNSFWPISDWDALALYDFRAKVFLVDTNLIHAALSNDYFIQYPLLTSLGHLFVYQAGLNNPKFVYSLFYLSFMTIFYYSLRKNVGENKAILFTIILSLVPEIFSNATIAYTNLPYAVYICTGTFYLYDWIKNKEHWSLLLSSVLVGLSSWVRITEPFWLVPLLIVGVVATKSKRIKEILFYAFPILTFYLSWKIFMDYVIRVSVYYPSAFTMDYVSIIKSISLEKVIIVFGYLYKNVFSTWGWILLLFILVTIRAFLSKKRTKNRTFLYVVFIYVAFLAAGTFVYSLIYSQWADIPDSVKRMSIFLQPLMIYSISLLM